MFGLHVLEHIGRPILERCGRVPRCVRSWEPYVGQKALVPDPYTAAVTRERKSEHVVVR